MEFVLMVFVAHFMGDYYLQTGSIAAKKSHSYFYTFIHSVCYTIPFYILWILFCDWSFVAFVYLSIIAWSHWIIDVCKVYVTLHSGVITIFGKKMILGNKSIYVLDQSCHYFLISLISICFSYYFSEQLSFIRINSFDLELLKNLLFIIVTYQPLYVSNRLLFCRNHMITNSYSLSHCYEKLLSVFIAVMFILKQYYLLIIFFILSCCYLYYKKKDNEWYRILCGIYVLNLIIYILLYGLL